MTKSDGVVSEVPGTSVTYTVVVSNAGPSDIVGAVFDDALPPALIGAAWTCAATGGSCAPSGSGSINTAVDLVAGGSATFTINAIVSSDVTGSITNTAIVTPPAGATDLNPSNNAATDTDTLTVVADLAITKTDNVTNVRPGDPVTYEIVVTNGPRRHQRCRHDVLPRSIRSLLTHAEWRCGAPLRVPMIYFVSPASVRRRPSRQCDGDRRERHDHQHRQHRSPSGAN